MAINCAAEAERKSERTRYHPWLQRERCLDIVTGEEKQALLEEAFRLSEPQLGRRWSMRLVSEVKKTFVLLLLLLFLFFERKKTPKQRKPWHVYQFFSSLPCYFSDLITCLCPFGLCLPALVQPSPFFLRIMVLLLTNIAVHQLCLCLHLGPDHLGIIEYEVQKKGST